MKQKKIIVYNIPGHSGADFVSGRNYYFTGDSILLQDDFLRNFHIKPARILYRAIPGNSSEIFQKEDNLVFFEGKRIMILDSPVLFTSKTGKTPVDIIIVSKNPRAYFSALAQHLEIKQVVFDGTNPAWKINYWKKDCDSLKIPYHDVSEKGAFVMTLN